MVSISFTYFICYLPHQVADADNFGIVLDLSHTLFQLQMNVIDTRNWLDCVKYIIFIMLV